MRFFKSIQFKAMVGMVMITAVSVTVNHALYYEWLTVSEQGDVRNRLEWSLFAYGHAPATEPEARERLTDLQQRFDLVGVALVDVGTKQPVIQLGVAPGPQRLQDWLAGTLPGLSSMMPDDPMAVAEVWGVRAVPGIDGKPALLVLAVSTSHARLTNRLLSISFWATLGATILLALFISYTLRHMLTRPIRRLAGALNRVARGDLSQRVDINLDQELVEPAVSFNKMIDELGRNREQIRDYQDSLEQRIAAAREELEAKEAELIEAAKLASVGQLAAGVAHEINSPIYHIMLTADLLQQDVKDAASKERIEEIAIQAGRCHRIIKDLLTYSQEGVPVDGVLELAPVIEAAVAEFKEQEDLASVELDLALPSDLPAVRGVAEEIRRVLVILLQNAVQALDGTGHIAVQAEAGTGGLVEVRVTDDGPGMSPSVRERAFEPFFTTKDVGQGTGLGLSIAHGILTRHDGAIALTSMPGQGTTVTVRLPRAEADAGLPNDREPM